MKLLWQEFGWMPAAYFHTHFMFLYIMMNIHACARMHTQRDIYIYNFPVPN